MYGVMSPPKQNTWKSETPKGFYIYLRSLISMFHTSESSPILGNTLISATVI